jgi:hypothetical protein
MWHVQDLAGTSGNKRIIEKLVMNPILRPIPVLLCPSRHVKEHKQTGGCMVDGLCCCSGGVPSLLALHLWSSPRDGQECITAARWGIKAILALPWRTLRGLLAVLVCCQLPV